MKAASIMLIKHYASAFRDINITFNAIAPGGINGEEHDQSFLTEYRKSTSNIGLIHPEAIASSVSWIISNGTSLNGTIVNVDAGWACD